MRVAVVGAGFAGVAAAFGARRAGASVAIIHDTPGASALYAGAVDGSVANSAELVELAKALGLRLGGGVMLATRAGVVRPSHGRDGALLDVAPLAGKSIAVVDVARDDWDAPLLARAFSSSAWAVSTGTRFVSTPLPLLERSHQRRTSSFDFAASFERAERPGWLCALLKAHAGPDAWLFGPWLGLQRPLAEELAAAAGVPVGEVTSPPGGVAGARFEFRRDALLASLGVDVVRRPLARVAASPTGLSLTLAGGEQLQVTSLVVASGGLVGGGVRLTGALSGAEPAGFELTLAGLPEVELRGELARPISSLFGVDLGAKGRGVLERAGLAVQEDGAVRGAGRIFAAGDVVAPEPPGVGHALTSGLRAGVAAAQFG